MNKPPPTLDPLAAAILQALAGRPEAAEIVLGGYLALQHHLDYRKTHDIDAWWRTRANPETEQVIMDAMERVAAQEKCKVHQRRFGETLSVELVRGGQKIFSFQIAVRSVELEPPRASAWPPMLIETLSDTVGSKMNALVDRGAPRDFLDIRAVVERGLVTNAGCWELWAKKNSAPDVAAAKQKVLHHLANLELRRPLDSIADPKEQNQAQAVREWLKREFLT